MLEMDWMTNILIIAKRFYPPWSDGIVSYVRGLVESILELNKLGEDLKVTVLGLTDEWLPLLNFNELNDYLKTRSIDLRWFHSCGKNSDTNIIRILRRLCRNTSFDIVHEIYESLNPVLNPIAIKVEVGLERKTQIFKHLIIYPIDKTFFAQRAMHLFVEKVGSSKAFNVRFSVSSPVLQGLYGLRRCLVLPPAVDGELYQPVSRDPLDSEIVESLTRTTYKVGDLQSVLSHDIIVLYIGHFVESRFNYETILKSVSVLAKEFSVDVGLIAIGRECKELNYLRDVKQFIDKQGLNTRAFFCVKALSDLCKVRLLNRASMFIDFFQQRPSPSVIFPPIAILECMSVGGAVAVTGGLPYLQSLVKDNENGVLIHDVSDEMKIARGLWKAIVHQKRLSSAARTTIRDNYSITRVSKTYLKMLNGRA